MKSQKSRQPRAELQVQSVEGGGWTWCYVEPDDGVELYSNETYTTVDDAKEWARRAYPDLPFAEAVDEDEADEAKGADEQKEADAEE